MASISVVLLSIFIIPVVGSTIILRYFFPKHALRISDSYLITIGTGLTLLINVFPLYCAFKIIVPNSAIDLSPILTWSLFQAFHNKGVPLLLMGLWIITIPLLFSWGFFWLMKQCFWQYYCRNQESGEDNRSLRFKIGEFISNSVLNFMAKLTTFSPEEEILIVDILDNGDSLYSGIFTDFFIEHGKFTGISLASVIRYSFKSERDRKEDKNKDSGGEPYISHSQGQKPYILPKLGEMYFPAEKIQNLHFWKIKKGSVLTKKLERPFDEVMLVWYILLQNTYGKMNLQVQAHVDEDRTQPFKALAKTLSTLPRLDLSRLEIVKIPQKSKSTST